MALNIGSTTISAVYRGSTLLTAVYSGANLVWPISGIIGIVNYNSAFTFNTLTSQESKYSTTFNLFQ